MRESAADRGYRKGPRTGLTYKAVAEKLGVSRNYATVLLATMGHSDAKQCRRPGCRSMMFAYEGAKVEGVFCGNCRPGGSRQAAPSASNTDRARRLLAAKAKYPR